MLHNSFTASDAFSPEVLAACLGDEVTFSCTVIDSLASQATIWTVDTTNTSEVCGLAHTVGGDDDKCGPFTAELGVERPGNCYPSTLRVTATQAVNDTLIQCFSPTQIQSDRVGSGRLLIRIQHS